MNGLPEGDESRLLCPHADPEKEDPRGTEQQVHRQAHVAKQLVPVGACRGQETPMVKCSIYENPRALIEGR